MNFFLTILMTCCSLATYAQQVLNKTAPKTGDVKPVNQDMQKSDAKTSLAAPSVQPPVIYTYPTQQPEPSVDIASFLQTNLHYPDSALVNNIMGRVIVRFVVNEDGSLTDITVVRGIGSGCDEEAVRVLKSMPKWKPGKQYGKPVKVYYTLPIAFRL